MEQTKQYEYVDLGLPSGLKWAKCNVGAKKETDYGYYFQWGDIVDKSNVDCSWASYKHCKDFYDNLTKYNTSTNYGVNPDNKTTLDTVDDAARANMGGDWRMPTLTEIQELLDNTDKEWIKDYNGTGVNGRKFTSKTDTSKYIFFPAAGLRSGSLSFYQGYLCDVWSSSVNILDPFNAWDLDFSSGNFLVAYMSRDYGLSVRGVLNE